MHCVIRIKGDNYRIATQFAQEFEWNELFAIYNYQLLQAFYHCAPIYCFASFRSFL